jgi:hypothetical protein
MSHQKVSHHLIRDARILIFNDIIIFVAENGDDETGDLGNPFRNISAALKWATSNLDFRCCNLTIKVGNGNFMANSEGVWLQSIIPGLHEITIQGNGYASTTIGNVVSKSRSFDGQRGNYWRKFPYGRVVFCSGT